MNITGLGLDTKGNLIFRAQDESVVAQNLIERLEHNAPTLKSLTRTTAGAFSFRSEAERAILDAGDPQAAGWTFLVNEADPQVGSVVEILQPLANHRGMSNPTHPLMYRDEARDYWFEWLHDEYYCLALAEGTAPQYILLVGSPQKIPFGFQSVLATVANVGRADLESLDHLQAYADKILRLETAPSPVVNREVLFFAPDGGLKDPTYFSRKYMAEPLAEYVREKLGVTTRAIIGDEATKGQLVSALSSGHPALIYTASHGIGAIDDSSAVQRRLNGAICCQSHDPLTSDSLFSAEDVPMDKPFLEGSIVFQFGCFGYGTPSESDYAHWIDGVRTKYVDADFVAALPRKLLAHPRGPIAYVGHLDTAFLHAFADADAPHIIERWHGRIAPFLSAVRQLLRLQPSGLSLKDMSTRYSACNALITSTYDRQRRGRLKWTNELRAQFLDRWITRGDAQNYMILGDPATRLRMPD